MSPMDSLRHPGISAALAAALLFGAGTPVAKLLLDSVGPWMLAGLLYLGSGLGLTVIRTIKRAPRGHLTWTEVPWFARAVLSGGIVGPVLLMFGLTGLPASSASLLLNAESVFTALLAWFVFRENFDKRIAAGMLAIVAGALILSVPGELKWSGIWPSVAVLGACFAWGIDNNLTRKVALADAAWIASVKGWASGIVNLSLAIALNARLPSAVDAMSAMAVGLLAYGASLTLFVVGLRHLGTARTGAYFSVAPFFGAAIAVVMGEPITWMLVAAGLLMAAGTWLHITERHEHTHDHEAIEHEHEHIHDEHHLHSHDEPVAPGTKHSHWHRHQPLTHSHPHFPDSHHRHRH